jgi:glycosyltransferase involved in cell wall biosynthesis
MTARIVIGSLEVPGIGGNSTASYDLFTRMLSEGRDVHYVSLIAEDPGYLSAAFGDSLGNPAGLPNVYNHYIEVTDDDSQPKLARLIQSIAPDVLVGFGFPGALLFKRALKSARTVLVTGSCRQAAAWVTTGRATDAVDLRYRLQSMGRRPRILIPGERAAVEKADLIITHSALTLEFMSAFFPDALGKIYPRVISFAEWIAAGAERHAECAQPFHSRDIDALFISNDWSRPEKNYPLVIDIVGRLNGLNAHIVGDVPRKARGAVHQGFVASRREMFELIGRAKAIVCPSLIDAAPGVLFEGAVMGCNLVASHNCGNADMCHPDLTVARLSAADFAASVRKAVGQKYEDGFAMYRAADAYGELMATLDAFAHPFKSLGAA